MTKLLHSNGIWWFFAALVVFVYFYGLGMPLVGPDEPRYAQVAREMWQAGNWITPTLGGFEWFEKPALLYWLQIASYNIFGVTEFAARFGSALFGLGTIVSVWILGRSLATEDTEKNSLAKISVPSAAKDFPKWAALITATTIGMLVFSRGASFDIIVTFPLTASLVGFFIFDHADEERARVRFAGLFAFYFFAGVSVLAKGLIGIVFPFAIVAFYFLLSRRFPSKQFLLGSIWGFAVIIFVAAVWNLPMYLQHGWKFIDEFYIQHHFQRFTSNKYRHPGPIYYFLIVLPLMTFPWLPFFILAVWNSAKNFFRPRDTKTQSGSESLKKVRETIWPRETLPQSAIRNPQSLTVFAISWILVPLVFFSFSGSKLPGYILPAVPPAAILTAMVVSRFVQKSDFRKALCFGVALATLASIAASLNLVAPPYFDADSVKRLVQTADANGYSKAKVASFRTSSQGSEFYAAGRLIRDENGAQRRFENPSDIAAYQQQFGEPLLVLVPLKQLDLLADIASEPIAENGDLAIVVIGAQASAARRILSISAAPTPVSSTLSQ